jgi:hypothetical protein
MGGITDTTSSSSKSSDAIASQQTNAGTGNTESFLPSFITVDIIGFGNSNAGDGAEAKLK